MNNHLLIVDDLDINRDVLRTMFEKEYQVLEAESGEEAVKTAKQYGDKLALVLLDIRMPGISGLDILQMKKDGLILENVPVIVITASDDPKVQLEAFKLGALDYITKPFIREVVEYRVANASLRTAYRELNEAAQEKERALELSQDASRAKSRFLTRMSHELRTPMNAIIGLTRMLQDSPKDSAELLEKLDLSARHLLGLLNEMMDITEIESGKVVFHRTKVLLSEFLKSVDAQMSAVAQKNGIEYHGWTAEELAEVSYLLDEQKLREVLLCLLDNSVKFTPRGGRIDCTAERAAAGDKTDTVRFTVEDTGVGIAEKFLPRVFDEFETEDTENTTNYGGVGLGLAICKSTVELMGGQVRAESRKGSGSRFIIELPLEQGKKSQDDLPIEKRYESYDFTGRKILLAEDNEVNRVIAVRQLEFCHANVETVENGLKAVELFEASPEGSFDAVLMDIRMPVMDGLTASIRIRELEREDAKSVPIIAMTANAYAEDVQKSLSSGMNAHLSKPVEPETLYKTLKKFLNIE